MRTILRVAPIVDGQACAGDGAVHVQVGRSAGYIFYDQPSGSTSTIRTTTASTLTGVSPPASVPVSFTASDRDSGGGAPDGGAYCARSLLALPGQRIRLRVIAVGPRDDPVASGESAVRDATEPSGTDTCRETLVIQDSALPSAVQLPVCLRRQRDSQIYLSIGHRISIRVLSGVHNDRPGEAVKTPRSSPPTGTAQNRRSGFLLTYECQCYLSPV